MEQRNPEDMLNNRAGPSSENDMSKLYHDVDDVLTDWKDDEYDVNTDDRESVHQLVDAPMKRKRKCLTINDEELFSARRRLFTEELEPPTQNTFYMEGEKIDMNDPNTCRIQRSYFARIYHALENFAQATENKQLRQHRNALWAAYLTKDRLTNMKNEGYVNYHYDIPKAVAYILRELEDIRRLPIDEMIIQLVPITCTIDKSVKDRLHVTGLEVRKVNNSESLSVNLSFDLKFLYGGRIVVKKVADQLDKCYVSPTVCMGNYMDVVVNDLYDLVFDRTKEYVENFLRFHPEDPATSTVDLYNHETPKGGKNTKEENDRKVLSYILRTVGRQNNLRKVDIDRVNVFVLTSVKSKLQYLNAKDAGKCTIDNLAPEDTEAVFLSSFVRARIMEDGTLNFQIYSRTCIYLSDNEEFPTV